MIGELLSGRYKIVQVLSAGGMAQTYIAEDLHRPGYPKCVVKHLKTASANAYFLTAARSLFDQEANTLEQLGHHPQIPRLLAHFEQNTQFYLVQELIEGHPLSAEMRPGQRWSDQDVVKLLREILEILAFVHSKGVIHRDIKPDNIIRRPDGKLVLIDFGAVKEINHQFTTKVANGDSMAIGTNGYMPTEQAQGKPRPNSDIYALGMVAIQALTGLMPVQLPEDPETGEVLWQHIVEVNQDLAEIVSKMVRYHFKDRYQTSYEALQTVQQLEINLSAGILAEEKSSSSYQDGKIIAGTSFAQLPPQKQTNSSKVAVTPTLKRKRKKKLLLGGLLGLSALLISLGAYALSQSVLGEDFAGDGVLDIGVVTTQYNQKADYLPLVEHIQSQLGSRVEVKLHPVSVDESGSLATANQKIKTKEWDLAFTTSPIVSATAVNNNYVFLARMFPAADEFQSVIFVKVNSKIKSIDDLNSRTKIALANFDSAFGFYMPIYDLYGKVVQLDLNNSPEQIVNKVKSNQVSAGVGIYQVIKNNPEFRILSVSRGIPLAGVYVSDNLKEKEQNKVKEILLKANSKIQEQAQYQAGKPIDYNHFNNIIQRVENLTGCTDLTKNPVQLFCSPNSQQNLADLKQIEGEINGYKLSKRNTIHVTLQGNDSQIYCLIIPRSLLNKDPDLPPLSAWNGKKIRVQQRGVMVKNLGTLELQITQPGQINFI